MLYVNVPVAGQVLTDPLLVIPEQAVQGEHISITNKRQAVVHRITRGRVRCYIQKKSAQKYPNKATVIKVFI